MKSLKNPTKTITLDDKTPKMHSLTRQEHQKPATNAIPSLYKGNSDKKKKIVNKEGKQIRQITEPTRGSPQAPSSSFLIILIVSK